MLILKKKGKVLGSSSWGNFMRLSLQGRNLWLLNHSKIYFSISMSSFCLFRKKSVLKFLGYKNIIFKYQSVEEKVSHSKKEIKDSVFKYISWDLEQKILIIQPDWIHFFQSESFQSILACNLVTFTTIGWL